MFIVGVSISEVVIASDSNSKISILGVSYFSIRISFTKPILGESFINSFTLYYNYTPKELPACSSTAFFSSRCMLSILISLQ